MKRPFVAAFILCLLLFMFLLNACSGRKQTAIEGKFKNLGNAECYIFSEWMGETRFDTVHLEGGKFRHVYPLADTTILTLQYPSFMQLHFVAAPGQVVKIRGDATNLRTTRVTGSRDNELLTEFRFSLFDKSDSEQQQLAEDFIKRYPETMAAQVVFEQYFLKAPTLDYTRARHLLRRMQKAAPERLTLRLLSSRVSPILDHAPGKQMPSFNYTTADSTLVSDSILLGVPYVVWFWSSWRQEFINPVRSSRDMYRKYKGKLGELNICLDTDTAEFHRILKRDSLPGINVCDRQGWSTPLAQELGINSLPSAVLVDKSGKIVGRDLSKAQLDSLVEKTVK